MYMEGASEYFRIGWPAKHLNKNFKDEFQVTLLKEEEFDPWDIATLRQFDIIHFHTYFGRFESSKELWGLLQAQGVKMVMDIDDYWELPKNTPLAGVMVNRSEEIKNNLKLADYVTTTTSRLAKEISEHNSNVMVLPNGLDTKHAMWEDNPSDSDVVRIGWLGSMRRMHDLELLRKGVQMLYSDSDLEGKFVFVVFGGEGEYEEIFKGPGFTERDGVTTSSYGYLYNDIDICLAPLMDCLFNSCRSELKYIEAGIKNKVFVGQNRAPYAEGIEHGVNGMLVDTPEEWYSNLRQLILNKELRDTLRNNLHSLVVPKFDITNLTRKRAQFYKSICND